MYQFTIKVLGKKTKEGICKQREAHMNSSHRQDGCVNSMKQSNRKTMAIHGIQVVKERTQGSHNDHGKQ